MKAKLAALGDVRKAQLTRQADRMATEFEAQRELDSVCLVVDMDMFYAAVEIRSGSPLKHLPVPTAFLRRHPSPPYCGAQRGDHVLNRIKSLLASVAPAASSATYTPVHDNHASG